MSEGRVTQITSAENPVFKRLKKIAGSARERRKLGQTLLDGIHLLTALADSGGKPELVILRAGAARQAEIAECLARFTDTPAVALAPKLFDALSPVDTPVGIAGLIDIPRMPEREYFSAVLLENIQDPGNLGGILRTSAAAGVSGVFLSAGCAEAWSPKVLRSGMGAHFAIAILEHQELAKVAHKFDRVVATTLGGELSIYELELTGSVAFIFGNEGAGLSPELAHCATHNARIPMPGKVESLNVAAAAAVCLFERLRQSILT